MWSEAEGELRDVKTRGLGESDGRDSGRLRAETLARFHEATDSPANKTDPRKRPEGGKLNTKDVNNNNKKRFPKGSEAHGVGYESVRATGPISGHGRSFYHATATPGIKT